MPAVPLPPPNAPSLTDDPDYLPPVALAPGVPLAGSPERWRGTLKLLSTVLGDRARWIILRELARHGQLPLSFLAARAGIKAPTASQHMQVLKKAGVVVKAMGRLYRLHPSLQPPPGAEFLDLGPALIRLPE